MQDWVGAVASPLMESPPARRRRRSSSAARERYQRNDCQEKLGRKPVIINFNSATSKPAKFSKSTVRLIFAEGFLGLKSNSVSVCLTMFLKK